MSTLGWIKGHWLGLFLLIGGGLLIAFVLFMIYDSSRRNSAADRRNVADLAILTDGLEQWPRSVAALGDNNVYKVDQATVERRADGVVKRLYHPNFHDYEILYSPGRCRSKRSIGGALETGGAPRMETSGPVRLTSLTAPLLDGLPAGIAAICYSVSLPLEPMLRVREVAPNFSHLLILRTGGDVVAQLGGDPLPLKNAANLPELQNALIEALKRGSAAAAPSPRADEGVLAPFDTAIAGKAYRLYQRPFSLGGAESGGDRYLAVAVVPHERVQAGSMRVSRDTVTAFALAFALLLALLPVIKLRLLGPVDDLSKLETAAVVLGLCVASWIAAMALGYSLFLVQGRTVAEARARQTAALMAEDVGKEIASLFAPRSDLRSMVQKVLTPPASVLRDREAVRLLPAKCGLRSCPEPIPRPDTVLLVDSSGGQVEDSPVVTYRIDAGAYTNVAERSYFQRALHREFALPTSARGLYPPIPCLEPNYTVEQVRSLPDGIARTIFALPVDPGRTDCVAARGRAPPAVAITGTVLRSLLSPMLRRDVQFMIVDRLDPRLRALFHSTEPRALVESLEEHSKESVLRSELAQLAPKHTKSFVADYGGQPHIFAAAAIPHTSWAVLTHVDRRRVDERSADIALGALWLAVALAALAALVILCGWLRAHHRLWIWLWPNAHCREGYRTLVRQLLFLAAGPLIILIVAWTSPNWSNPLVLYIAVALFYPAVALAWLWLKLGRSKWATNARSYAGIAQPDRCADRRLTKEAEHNYLGAIVILLMILMVFPAGAQFYDAAAYVSQAEAAAERRWLDQRDTERRRRLLAIARTYSAELRRGSLPAGSLDCREGSYVLREDSANLPTMLGIQRRLAFHRDEPRALPLPCERAPPPAETGSHLAAYLTILLLIFFFSIILWKSLRSTLSGLFGFGIALEAVEQPGHRDDWDWEKAPRQTLVVGAPIEVQATIREDDLSSSPVKVIDLVSETDQDTPQTSITTIESGTRVVIENLELLLRDPMRRYRALRLLELLVARQRRQSGIKVVVLTDLSPLERLLQRFERDSEVLESANTPEARKQLDDIKRNREDVRWSRLFASFATFSHRRMSDRVPEQAGELLIAWKGQAANDPLDEAQRKRIAQRVLEELAPLPGHVVRCGLPYLADDAWQVQFRAARELNAVSSRAVVDHFASVFIEHYQLIWSASSLAERLIMYHLAHGRVVSIERAYAVRTLVRRGIVVLDPVPRLFNRSFAQFVRNVEKPETLQRWRLRAPAGAWAKAQLPMLLLIPVGLVTLLILVKQSGQSALALAPILVTAAPALLQAFGVVRRPGTA